MNISVNSPCPCGSHKKYKRCCQIYHKGALPKDALYLMKSRYSAYVVGIAKYIIKTTHPENPAYHDNIKVWEQEIDTFCKENSFIALEVIDFYEEGVEAHVHFKAHTNRGILEEKSRFIYERGRWFYLDGEIIIN